ncbi:hypothetical protein [Paraburkholderia sp. BL10I2N1]|uniref:hypothetical protein n=1 Tax=Paraburkholderia sp. BL10I2N1 TaxID=1938796 RepID=UPI00105BFEBA|nr:hypothetical protein [Paraburkholderia sp. BL10I2N1]
MAAFGKGYIAHPDALALAADHYETTLTFKRELKEALETVDPQARDNELERHVEMYSAAANDAAMHLRVALNAYEPEEYRYSNDAHQTAFAAILELRKEEIEERAHGRSCVTLTEHEERQNALFGRSFE